MPGTVRAFSFASPKIFEGRSGRAPRAPLGQVKTLEEDVAKYPLTLDCTPECILRFMASIQNGVPLTFQIGELAKRTALSIDAIRFYERRKLLPPASRSAGRFRLYTPDAIERLRFVRRMQDLGFSLQEIKELMGVRADRAHACVAVRQFLKTKLADVAVRIRELQQLETELKADLRKCNRALNQQRGKTCACPVLEGEERTSNA